MAATHDYDTKIIPVTDLNDTHVIVGECGGLSAVFDSFESSFAKGLHVVETEHGGLYFFPTAEVEVLDLH